MEKDSKSLWEILVPAKSNSGLEYAMEHHWAWDKHVRAISGGLTIFRSAKGQWISPEGALFNDKMIPVRLYCAENDIDDIIRFTLEHYDQQAVMAYRISDYVKLAHRKSP